MTTEGG